MSAACKFLCGLLPCFCRNHQWGQSKCLRGLISSYAPLENDKDKYVTSTDEALVGIIYENCARRFPFVAKLTVPFDQAVHTLDKEYQAKWSSSSKGQSKFGGWDGAAVVRFDQIATIVSLNRKKRGDFLKEVETAALNLIQGKKCIEDGSLDVPDEDDEQEKVEVPKSFAALAYDSDVDPEMEVFDLEAPVEVYLPVPETKEQKKKKAKASRRG